MTKIYTKKGDFGETSLLGGTRVMKYNAQVEAYGTIDELCSWIGLIRDLVLDFPSKKRLFEIQKCLFLLEAHVASETKQVREKLNPIKKEDIDILEQEIDSMNEHLKPLTNFVIPGGFPLASYIQIARTVCRRAERRVLQIQKEADLDLILIQYLNRLSDFLFVFARKQVKESGGKEILWKM